MTREEALIALLARPDEHDALRTHTRRLEGDPARFALLKVQPTVYAAHAQIARDNEVQR